MGGGKTSSTTVNKTEIPGEIRERGTQITNAAMGHYMPGDPASPSYYRPYTGQLEDAGWSRTAGPNYYHSAAGEGVQRAQTSYQPYMEGAGQAGAFAASQVANNPQSRTYASTGANYDQDGNASFTPFDTDSMQRFANPYQSMVTGTGLQELYRQHDIAQQGVNDGAAKAGAFGGARHGVQAAETTRGFADMGQKFLADTLDRGYGQARDQYNTERNALFQQQQMNNAGRQQDLQDTLGVGTYLQNLGSNQQQRDLGAAQGALGLAQNYQQMQQQAMDRGYDEYKQVMDRPLDVAERLASMNAMQPVNRTSTSTTNSSTSGGGLGAALYGFGSIMPMFSDEDAKTNIEDEEPEEVLGAFSAMPSKTFEYKDPAMGEGERTGFMAQDYEQAFGEEAPEVDGMKALDIPDMIGKLAVAVKALEERTRGLVEDRT
jgi:hypothetical protein